MTSLCLITLKRFVQDPPHFYVFQLIHNVVACNLYSEHTQIIYYVFFLMKILILQECVLHTSYSHPSSSLVFAGIMPL
jgi:hypothetical protein